MVMEAPPSPQSVGREFVRQYYTLLNKAPAHLHRFYNNHSSFVHGGLDAPNRETSPMIGQKQIHQKIQQLNFKDCHAKITQVDSQATLGNGVVVQVTGELSNAGQPMRRFTQTFVLAAQAPKKYYVHNDIFRYQDEIFTDEECDQESGRSDVDEELVSEQQPVQEVPQQIPQQPIAYYAPNTVTNAPLQPPAMQVHHPTQIAPVMPVTPVPTVNGAVHPDEVIIQAQVQPTQMAGQPVVSLGLQLQVAAPVLTTTQGNESVATVQPVPEPVEEPLVNSTEEEKLVVEPEVIEEPVVVQEPVAPVSNEPKTYATLVKSGGNAAPSSFASAAMSTSPNQQIKPIVSSPPPIFNRPETCDQAPLSNISGTNATPLGQRSGATRVTRVQSIPTRGGVRQEGRSGPGRASFNEDNDDRRRSAGPGGSVPNYPDSHQLFLGNLPHHATEDDLKEIFSTFGAIADLRIHSKSPTKGMPGTRVPNYGFITFEDLQSAQNCLQSRPLFFPPKDESGQKLNVEEKKTRPRPSMDSGRSGSAPGQESGQGMGSGRSGNGPGSRPGTGPGMMRSGGPGRGGRGGFNRSEGRGGGPNRGGSNNFNRR